MKMTSKVMVMKLGQMEAASKVLTLRARSMVKVSLSGPMARLTRESFATTTFVAMDSTCGLTAILSKALGQTIRWRERVCTPGLMDAHTKDSIRMT